MLQRFEQKDQAQLAALIYSSGENNLNYLFSNQAHAYLQFALSAADGQFGFGNQHVIRQGAQIVACGSCWTNSIPKHYHSATLKSLVEFFGTEKTVSILHKSSLLNELLSPPQQNELGIGHFAVSQKYKRNGFGKAMLDHYVATAKQLDKTFLVLDVDVSNLSALNFYYNYGFQLEYKKTPNSNALSLNLKPHLHLRFPI